MCIPDCQPFLSKFVNFYFNPTLQNRAKEELVKEFEDEIEEARKNGKLVLIKDVAFIILQYYPEEFSKLVKKFNAKLIYIIRHPKPTYSSFNKLHQKDLKDNTFPPKYFVECDREKYELTWQFYEKHRGLVIIAEDLQRDPKKTLQEVFRFMEVEYNDSYLRFPKLVNVGIPEGLQTFIHWYEDCVNSTEFKVGVTNIDAINIEDRQALEQIEYSTRFYQLFLNERISELTTESSIN